MVEPNDTYLGDGLYCRHDDIMITLLTERDDGTHFIGLAPEVFEELLQFAIRIGWLEKGQVLHGR